MAAWLSPKCKIVLNIAAGRNPLSVVLHTVYLSQATNAPGRARPSTPWPVFPTLSLAALFDDPGIPTPFGIFLDARAVTQSPQTSAWVCIWYPTSHLWLAHLFSKIQAIYHFSFELSLNHKYWYTRLSPRDVSFWQVEMVSLHTPWCLPGNHTEKTLINVQGMSKWWMAACVMEKTHSIIWWQME